MVDINTSLHLNIGVINDLYLNNMKISPFLSQFLS